MRRYGQFRTESLVRTLVKGWIWRRVENVADGFAAVGIIEVMLVNLGSWSDVFVGIYSKPPTIASNI